MMVLRARFQFALVLGLLVAGCASLAQYPAPTQERLAWAYHVESSTVNMVAYTSSKETCAVSRAKDSYSLARDNAWLGARVGECQPMRLVPGGSAYWGFDLVRYPGMGLAFSTRNFCEMSRKGWPVSAGPVTACGSIDVVR